MPEEKKEKKDPFEGVVIETLRIPEIAEEEIYLLKLPDGSYIVRHKDELEKMKKEGKIR